MSSIRVTTNFRDNFGTDLGDKLITKDYLMSVYPGIAQEIGKTPELWVWGTGTQGQLGINIIVNRFFPVTTFAGGTNWKQVSSGTNFTAAIKTDGTLWVWGSSSYGKLGNRATTGSISTPSTSFAGGTNWKQVSAGTNHAAAIKTDGTLWTWGYGSRGRLGINDTTNRSTPVTTFAGGTNWKQVGCGYEHMAAIKTDGTLWVWGDGGSGRLGNGLFTGTRPTPVTTFAGGTNWKQVSCGDRNTAAIKTDGTLWTWGYGDQGVLGNGVGGNRATPVTTFAGGTNWKQVSASGGHSAAIKTDGTLWTWGTGTRGRLGNRFTSGTFATPVTTFAGGTNWKQVISNTFGSTAAIKTDGTLWTWGYGVYGRLGNNSTTNKSTPVTTSAGGTNWKQVSSGDNHTAAIKSADFI